MTVNDRHVVRNRDFVNRMTPVAAYGALLLGTMPLAVADDLETTIILDSGGRQTEIRRDADIFGNPRLRWREADGDEITVRHSPYDTGTIYIECFGLHCQSDTHEPDRR